jgi:precorrin-2 dehydrogenase / sirohydrochlorin ferrochelatase
MFPLVLDLTGRRVVVVGAGTIGARKAHQLVESGATVTVISPQVTGDLPDDVEVVLRAYRHGDLADTLLVVSAAGRDDVNDAVVAEARQRNVLVNVVDDPLRSTFFFTAVHRDGEVCVSVSTEGASPALARWVRDDVARTLPRGLGRVARRLRAERRALHDEGVSAEGLDWTPRIDAALRDHDVVPLV